jgi:ABC-type glycerol-3-phosphate transport system substrate-binding protein
MKSRMVALLVSAVALALVLTACGSSTATPAASGTSTTSGSPAATSTAAGSTSPSELTLQAAPWTGTEKDNYQLVDAQGKELGTTQFTFAKQDNQWTISETDTISQTTIDSKMTLDATTLKPIGEERNVQGQSGNLKLTTKYTNGKLDITAVTGTDTKTATIDVPADAIDNDQLLMTLRALNFKQGLQQKFNLVVSSNALMLPTTVRVLSQESITVPAGTFNTWKTEFDLGQSGTLTCWYGVDAPNLLVKEQQGQASLILTGTSK